MRGEPTAVLDIIHLHFGERVSKIVSFLIKENEITLFRLLVWRKTQSFSKRFLLQSLTLLVQHSCLSVVRSTSRMAPLIYNIQCDAILERLAFPMYIQHAEKQFGVAVSSTNSAVVYDF